MNLCIKIGGVLVLSLFLMFEVGVMIIVTDQIPLLNSFGLVRYHAQRALNCYILILQENTTIFDTTIFKNNITDSKVCFDTSYGYINNFQKSSSHLFGLCLGHTIESALAKKVRLFVPNIDTLPASVFTNFTEMQNFIGFQSRLHEDIVVTVTTMIRENSDTLITFYIINYVLLFVFVALTFAYVYRSNRVKKWKHSVEVEKNVINQLCHELCTSLTPIEMYSRELMGHPKTDFEQKQFVNNYILNSLMQHKYILKSRLDFEKILSNEYELRLDNEDVIMTLNCLIEETKQYILLANKPIEVALESPFQSLYVRIDKLILHYILTNVLRNSVKYSSEGQIKISIAFDEHTLCIEIHDEGTGLTDEMVKKLNEPTGKTYIVHAKSGDSYGLGIPFTKKLVSILDGGQYFIKSTQKGSCTTIKFESKHADYEYIVHTRLSMTLRYNVCVTDDCPIVRNVMKRTFAAVLKDVNTLQFCNGESLLRHSFVDGEIYFHVLDQNMKSTGGVLLGHEVACKIKTMKGTHYTISMSGNELNVSEREHFDLLWNKPPPPNDVIYRQIRDLFLRSELPV